MSILMNNVWPRNIKEKSWRKLFVFTLCVCIMLAHVLKQLGNSLELRSVNVNIFLPVLSVANLFCLFQTLHTI